MSRILTDKDRIKKFDYLMSNIVSKDFRNWLVNQGFFVKPAAIKHHGNYIGGLFDHSLEVMDTLVNMTDKLKIKWSRPESPYIVGMFHDLCKLDDYIDENAEGIVMMGTGSPISQNPSWNYNQNSILKGHGEKSVMLLSQFMTLTEEEIYCIAFHMGAYETEKWNQYDAAIKKYESVLWTHTADMYASKVEGV